MNERQALSMMKAPGDRREGIWRGGVLQVWVTRACDKACFGCTQGSNLAGKPGVITVEQFDAALASLDGYFGVVGMFGGNPATHPRFAELCGAMRDRIPRGQRGLWCNNPVTAANAREMRATFDPAVSNLNVHLDRAAHDLFAEHWPECRPYLKGLDSDSRHAPPYVALRDVVPDEGERWDLISRCDVNQRWSAMVGVFRGELRGWFCEIAGAQAMLHQHEEDYPDTGVILNPRSGTPWWRLPMDAFVYQVRKHCHECGIPLRPFGALACDESGAEQVSETHLDVFVPKRKGRRVELVTVRAGLGADPSRTVARSTDYIENGGLP